MELKYHICHLMVAKYPGEMQLLFNLAQVFLLLKSPDNWICQVQKIVAMEIPLSRFSYRCNEGIQKWTLLFPLVLFCKTPPLLITLLHFRPQWTLSHDFNAVANEMADVFQGWVGKRQFYFSVSLFDLFVCPDLGFNSNFRTSLSVR